MSLDSSRDQHSSASPSVPISVPQSPGVRFSCPSLLSCRPRVGGGLVGARQYIPPPPPQPCPPTPLLFSSKASPLEEGRRYVAGRCAVLGSCGPLFRAEGLECATLVDGCAKPSCCVERGICQALAVHQRRRWPCGLQVATNDWQAFRSISSWQLASPPSSFTPPPPLHLSV